MKKILIILLVIILGCTYKKNPEGLSNDIIVIASNKDKLLIKPHLDSLFYKPVFTPQEEHVFNLKWIKPWEINKFKNNYNLLLVSLKFPIDTTGDILFKKYLKASNTNEKIFLRENIYSNDQAVIGINSFNIIDFKKVITDNASWITSVFQNKYNKRVIRYIYSKGLNTDLIDYLSTFYKVNLDLQKDYMIIKENKDKKFIWMGRGFPYRWITLLKINNINNEYLFWNDYEYLSNKYIPTISLNTNYRIKEIITLNNESINVYRGIYDHEESNTGGPFVVYEIKDSKNDEIYLLSGYVNYPGHKKINLIKGIEVLFNTFKILEQE